jgi:hypothetical protein
MSNGLALEQPLETVHLGRWLEHINKKKPARNLRVGLERKTIAAYFFDLALIDSEYEEEMPGETVFGLRNWEFSYRTFRQLHEDCEKAGGELIGILTWEPHASWLKRMSKGEELKRVPLVLSPEPPWGRPRHLTYEVVVNFDRLAGMGEAAKRRFLGALKNLLLAFETQGHRLNAVRGFEDHDALEDLARYFGFAGPSGENVLKRDDLEETLSAITQIRYSVSLSLGSWL